MADSHSTEPPPARDTFHDGVRWGMFIAEFSDDDLPHADENRAHVLGTIVDQIDATPDAPMSALRAIITEDWAAQRNGA